MGLKLTSDSDVMIAQLVAVAMKEPQASKEFVAGEKTIPVAGKVFGEPDQFRLDGKHRHSHE